MMKKSTDILIVGAGACGLMAARELSKRGHTVMILEARDRIGGRIWPLPPNDFGFPADGGAELIHGKAKITKSLMKEAGLRYVPVEGEMWSIHDGKAMRFDGGPMDNPEIAPFKDGLKKALKALKKDMPVADFLKKNFSDQKHKPLREWITRMTEGFNAADPKKASTLAIGEEWLGGREMVIGRIHEGYAALLAFLRDECERNGVIIRLNTTVRSIRKDAVVTSRGTFHASRIIVTVPVSVLGNIRIDGRTARHKIAAKNVGYGNVVKFVLTFSDRWWLKRWPEMKKASFIFLREDIPTWWTQYPETHPVLTGWAGGPATAKFRRMSSAQIIDDAVRILAGVYGVNKALIRKELLASATNNWALDPFARGAYSYSTPKTEKAQKILRKPLGSRIFFAGEALSIGEDPATVEAALESGKEIAVRILKL